MGLVASATPATANDPAVLNVTAFPKTVGNRLVVVAAHRAGFTGVAVTPAGDAAWDTDVANDDYIADTSHRRGVTILSTVIDATLNATLTGDPFISVDFTGSTSTSVVAFCVEVDEGTGFTLAQTAAGDNGDAGGASTVASGTTASVAAGDVLVIMGVTARGGTTLTAGTYTDTESSFNEASENANSVCGALYAAYLTEASAGTYADTITMGTAREASTAIAVYVAAAAASIAFSSGATLAVSGVRRTFGTVAASTGATLAVNGVTRVAGAVSVSSGASLAVAGTARVLGSVAVSSGATLTVAGTVTGITQGTVAISSGATLSVVGVRRVLGSVAVASGATLAVAGTVVEEGVVTGSCSFTAGASLAVGGTPKPPNVATDDVVLWVVAGDIAAGTVASAPGHNTSGTALATVGGTPNVGTLTTANGSAMIQTEAASSEFVGGAVTGGTQTWTVLVYGRQTDTNLALVGFVNDNVNYLHRRSGQYRARSGTVLDLAVTTTTDDHVWHVRAAGASSRVDVDGDGVTGSLGDVIDAVTIGTHRHDGGAGQFADVGVAELLVVSGAVPYELMRGWLRSRHGNASVTGAVAVASGATLDVGGTRRVQGSVAVSAGATLEVAALRRVVGAVVLISGAALIVAGRVLTDLGDVRAYPAVVTSWAAGDVLTATTAAGALTGATP